MITLLSPSKTLDYSDSTISLKSAPDFKKEIGELVGIMKKKSPSKLKSLMKVSDDLANLNAERFQNFEKEFNEQNAKQALLAFKGDVYTKIDVEEFSPEDFEFAQQHLRILSGLYGLLKPLDLIQPYRLEMGTRLSNPKGKNLYSFWGTKIAKAINEVLDDNLVINLASQEYFKSVEIKALKAEVITPVFKEYRNGNYKVIGIFAKQARGMMANFIIKERINQPEKLKLFDGGGYSFDDKLSNQQEWVFIR
ncbi:peroxide stress protein YaaA [Pleomorphovibrio marinus]|uniref:peroxide stress protein YaaA n=1 Tax=Pleomorphovibrio marinus TaxID=2164132 RepID=UPI000E0C0FDB|nr:peroxide stress protein YaaA [Pleomorphovibrio marinus]